MYYIDSKNPYTNNVLKSNLEHDLPMDEFRNGNFSQAHKIIDAHKEYVRKCIESITYRKTNGEVFGETNLYKYQREKLASLSSLLAEQKGQRKKIIKELKTEGEGNKTWDACLDYLNKYCWDSESKDYFNLRALESAYERTGDENPEKYEEAKPIFEKFVTSVRACVEKIKVEDENIDEGWKNLANKQKIHSVLMQMSFINALERGIKEELFSLFRKADDNDKSLEEISMSVISADLILDSKTNKKTKMDLIKNHDDKISLFAHIWQIYNKESMMFFNIYTGRKDYNDIPKSRLKEDSITTAMDRARKIINKIPDYSAVWASYIAQENKDLFNKLTTREELKEYVVNDLVSHLGKTLNNKDEIDEWDRKNDTKLNKLFRCVYDVTEAHEFETFCNQIWTIDENAYRYILGQEGETLLQQVLLGMNEEERKIIKAYHEDDYLFKQIEKGVLEVEKQKAGEQLLLFPLPEPPCPIKGYSKQVVENILELVGKLPNGWERKMNSIVNHMLIKQGIDEYFNPSLPLPELTNELFLEELKKSNRSKEMYNKMKKITGKIFPDIKERIEHQKEVE